MRITGTFLDEITHDIPSQNWGPDEWEKDFRVMRAVGIDTVILIRCGWLKWITYPSEVLQSREGAYPPTIDLVELFLDLAENNGMDFYFGIYDSGRYWRGNEFEKEVDINCAVIDEVWRRYGRRKAFRGWYLSQEVSRRVGGIIDVYAEMGRHCKEVSGGLPVLISPWIEGIKAGGFDLHDQDTTRITPAEHEREWDAIMAGISGAVDIVAFQDGHVSYNELPGFLRLNMELAKKHALTCWTNTESFDRDMHIKFPPIKWEKLLLKLRAAEQVGVEKAITFEFSHFMSPNSCYLAAGNLLRRYCEHYGIDWKEIPR